jgi:nucleotide-binding universal stress UspA family protein
MLIKLILCPVDFSENSVKAYLHALSLAEHYGSKLVVQHVVELWRYPSASYAATAGAYDEFLQAICDGGKNKLQEFVKNHTYDGVHPELVVQEGMAPDVILSFAQSQKPNVIVMGTHGHRGFDRLMVGSVTNRVMRRAPCPVLAVPHPQDSDVGGREHGQAHHLNRILFCTDFSDNSTRALEYAVSGAAEYDAELTLLHVLEGSESSEVKEAVLSAVTEELNKLIPPATRSTLKIKTALRVGKPYQQIIQVASEWQSDLVIMGVHGRGAIDLAVFGSTTYRVIQLGPCPVLAVHI